MKRVSTGLSFIFLGCLLLAANFGLFRFSMIWNLIQFWPFILIFIGLDIIFSRTPLKYLGSTLSTISILGLIGLQIMARQNLPAGSAWTFGPVTVTRDSLELSSMNLWSCPKQDTEDLSDMTGVRSLKARISFGAGTLSLGASDTDEVAGHFSTCGSSSPALSTRGNRTATTVTIDAPARGWMMNNGASEWTLDFPESIPTSFEIETGASDNNLDFSHLTLTSLDLKTGASNTTVTLGGGADGGSATIDMGAASLTIRVPNGMALDIKSDTGLSTLDFPESITKVSAGHYQSARYTETTMSFSITLESGVSSISVEYYDPDDIPPVKDVSIPFESIDSGSQSPYPDSGMTPQISVIDSTQIPGPRAAQPDLLPFRYDEYLLLLILMGQQPDCPGYSVNTDSVSLSDNILTVDVTMTESSRPCIIASISSPYEVISVPKEDLPLDDQLTIVLRDQSSTTLDTISYLEIQKTISPL